MKLFSEWLTVSVVAGLGVGLCGGFPFSLAGQNSPNWSSTCVNTLHDILYQNKTN